jgi:7-cyano-7-deazaguanine synthase
MSKIDTINQHKAIVVFSGGQDSTTCLYWAMRQGWDVYPITFNYGQKHAIEIGAARRIVEMAGLTHKHEVVNLGDGILKGTSPLVNKDVALEQYASHQVLPGGLEKTFVPMRNQLFLTVAANRAFVYGARYIVTGVCQEDNGGYPDCRRVFINAVQDASNVGTIDVVNPQCNPIEILTPLMFQTKADTVRFAMSLPGCMQALAFSHTSYDGQYPPIGHDHATLLRAKGFEEAGVPDPLVERAVFEDLMPVPDSSNYDDLRRVMFNRKQAQDAE